MSGVTPALLVSLSVDSVDKESADFAQYAGGYPEVFSPVLRPLVRSSFSRHEVISCGSQDVKIQLLTH